MNKLFKDRKFLTIGAFLLLLIVAGIFRLLNRSNDLGFSVVSDFQKQLSAPMTADQTYIPLTNLMLTGETDTTCAAGSRCLDVATMGDEIFVTIDAGTSKVELIRCTASSSSTNRFTGCTRGLEFSGTSLSSVTGLAQTHRQGATVTVSNVHYIYEKFLDLTGKSGTTQTLTGDITVTGTVMFTTSSGAIYLGDNSSSKNKTFYARNGDANPPFMRYNESINKWEFADNGVDTVTVASSSAAGLSASSTQGIGITNSEIHVNASSTASTNGGFLDFSSAGRLFWDVASFLSGTWSWTGVNTFTAGFGRLFVPTPTDDGEAVNKLYADSVVPIGTVLPYASSTVPTGWLSTDGSAVSRTTYSALYATIGTTYGVGDGSTTFNLPDTRGRTIHNASSTVGVYDTMGETGGSSTHIMITAEMPAHTHNIPGASGSAGSYPAASALDAGGWSSGSAGSGTAFDIKDPYVVMNYIIKY